jgi:4-hydroxy-3-polyprenylbenzoate decarboxylase
VLVLRVVLGVTGASGVVYGVRLAEELRKSGVELTIIISDAAKKVLASEMVEGLEALSRQGRVLGEHEIEADVSSGSARIDATVICPCSMKTLSAIAHGYADNLISRSLENMLKLARLGITILPASPGFYHNPKSTDDLVNHIVGKIMDALGIESNLFKRWGS